MKNLTHWWWLSKFFKLNWLIRPVILYFVIKIHSLIRNFLKICFINGTHITEIHYRWSIIFSHLSNSLELAWQQQLGWILRFKAWLWPFFFFVIILSLFVSFIVLFVLMNHFSDYRHLLHQLDKLSLTSFVVL